MPFFNQLIERGIPYEINVDASAAGRVAITILKVNKRDRLAAAEQFSVPAGLRTTLTDVAGARIDRIIMAVHPEGNTQVSIEITQGAMSFAQTCNGDTDIVFDTMP
jgi:hypothetical protein